MAAVTQSDYGLFVDGATAFPGIPFGGFKQFGFGRELSLETLDLYLETKSVVTYTGTRPTNPFGL